MRITFEDAEAWYRGDEDQNVSAHQVAVFYREEYRSAIKMAIRFYDPDYMATVADEKKVEWLKGLLCDKKV